MSDPDLIPIAAAARLLKVTQAKLRKAATEGYIPTPKPGATTLVGAVQGYITYLREQQAKVAHKASAGRLNAARQAEVQLRIDLRRRQMISVEEARKAADAIAGAIAAELAALADRATPDPEFRGQIDSQVRMSQQRVSDALRKSG